MPMTPPSGSIPWKPVIPQYKYQHLVRVGGKRGQCLLSCHNPVMVIDSMAKVPMVKAKATSVIMNYLITKQTQESIQNFEQQEGLRDAGYTPYRALPPGRPITFE